jgi:hypothetical protein
LTQADDFILDRLCGLLWVLVLPEPQHPPALSFKLCIGIPVTPLVGADLVDPVSCVCFRLNIVFGASVPEAAVHEYSETLSGEYEVCGSPHITHWPDADPEPKSEAVGGGAEADFRAGVTAAATEHRSTYRLR